MSPKSSTRTSGPLLCSRVQGFAQQPAHDIGAGAAFGFGDLVDFGDRFGVQADRVEVTGHATERSTTLDNVIRRDTVSL